MNNRVTFYLMILAVCFGFFTVCASSEDNNCGDANCDLTNEETSCLEDCGTGTCEAQNNCVEYIGSNWQGDKWKNDCINRYDGIQHISLSCYETSKPVLGGCKFYADTENEYINFYYESLYYTYEGIMISCFESGGIFH